VDGQIFAPAPDGDVIKVNMPDSKIDLPESALDAATTTGKKGPVPVARFGFSEGRLVKIGGPSLTSDELKDITPAQASGLSMQFLLEPPAPENPLDIKDPNLLLSDEIAFKLDFSGTTNFASAFEVKRNEQDGYAAGSLTGLSVDDKGILRGQFTNGRTLVAGAIQLATFKGLGGLREVSNNTYEATPQSGDAIVGRAADGIFGSIRSNSVEEANTDMAGELVRLMVQQRNYQANAQSIRTQVEILSVTIDVTR